MRQTRNRPESPLEWIIHIYEDYKYANDKLLENFQPNDDYTLEYLTNRGERLEGAIAAIQYAKEYIESNSNDIPDPPWEKED